MSILLVSIHALSWSIYVGGAICMELVLRHAQVYMRPSQIAVVCQKAGRKYRWYSLICLILLLITGLGLIEEFDPVSSHSKVLIALGILWMLLMMILALLSFYIHPAMHLRASASMKEEDFRKERQRVARAIVMMDVTVRVELVLVILALLAGASLHIL